jgi:uncharacterized membrane protein YuzA (DUF378 family)
MDIVKKIAFILLVIGGLNWGLVGLFDYDLVAILPRTIAVLVYILVGVSAVISIFTMKSCGSCKKEDVIDENVEESMNQTEDMNHDDSVNNSQM